MSSQQRVSRRPDDGVEGTSFPPLPTSLTKPNPRNHAEHRFPFEASGSPDWPVPSVCRAALATLLSRYTRVPDVAFHFVRERANSSRNDQDSTFPPKRRISYCNVHVDPQQSRADLLQDVQINDSEAEESDQDSTHDGDTEIVDSQTVLAVTRSDNRPNEHSNVEQSHLQLEVFESLTDRALLLNCQVSDDEITIIGQFDSDAIDNAQMGRFLKQLGSVIQQYQGDVAQQTISELNITTEDDLVEIRKWNAIPPPKGVHCIHDLIAKFAASSPESPAVAAWDGDFTYAELDDLSSRLAIHIQGLDREAETIIPLCFEKSKVESICQQISPQLALVCESQRHKIESIVPRCITVDDKLVYSLPEAEHGSLPVLKPQNLAYVIFTSGSTGEPKGIMVEHKGLTSYATAFGPAFKIDHTTRALQFASYAYAVCLAETFGTLLTGGCLCIPSEHDRVDDIASFVRSSKANFAIFTPSFVGAIGPETVPSLKVLMMAGEPMTPETKETWAKHVQLLNGCGQSECLLSSIGTVDVDDLDVRVIGRGSGTRLWITEPGNSDRLAPVGCAGELLLEGSGVARGYLDLPEANKSKFLTTPPKWYPPGCEPLESAKFYKTGDLACYQSDGRVLNLGREDSQVKIRGQRVELGDVEFHLRKILPYGIKPVVDIVKRSHDTNRAILVAFLIGNLDTDQSEHTADSGPFILDHKAASHFTTQLETEIGRHAIPSYYVSIQDLPTTATGKTDRKRLRAFGAEALDSKDGNVEGQKNKSLPSEGPEATMAQLWADSMPVDASDVGMEDNFFDIGGDSIMAIQIVNKARAAGMALKVADVLENPVFADLVAVTGQEQTEPTQGSAIPIQSRDSNEAELSFAQRGLWFLEQLNPGTPAYNVSVAGSLKGPLKVDALGAALQALEDRHETFRTTFREREGTPVQVIQPCRDADDILQLIEIASNEELHEELKRQQMKAFNLQSTPPWRVALLRQGPEEHVLSIVMHHIISDGWSDDILRRNLAAFYSAAVAGRDAHKELQPLPIQYRDFASWQQHADQLDQQKEQLQYWVEQLADSAPAELLIDKTRPSLPSGVADVVEIAIDGSLLEDLQRFCKKQQTTSFVVLLAAFRAAHYRLTGAVDATIGTPNASRNRTEVEDLVGFFSNTQCMRITIEGETFPQLVQQVKATVTAALAHQDVPFERVVSEVLPGSRDASRNPLVQLMFAVHSQPNLGEVHLEGLEGEALRGTASTRFDLEFHLVQKADAIHGNVHFAQELFEPETIKNTVATFKEILRRGLEQPEVSINVLCLTDGLPELERRGFLDIAHAQYPRDSSITDVFAEQVAACPEAIAVKDVTAKLSYADLNRRSDALAAWLGHRGLGAETWIGVLAPRSCETIVAFLGILKANMAYVPLDIDAPSTRIESILSAFEGKGLVLLGQDVQAPDVSLEALEFAQISEALDKATHEKQSVSQKPSATSLAYVMFTSGSTGKPKGVMIEHRGVVRLVKETNVMSELPTTLVTAHLFNIAFDLSVWEIYAALLNGGTVICIDSATKVDPNALEQVFKREKIQAAMLPPVLLKTCLASAPEMLKGLAAFYNGADRFDSHDAKMARKLVPGRVANAYGPTENSALSTIYDVQEDDTLTNGVPIGESISNSGAYVMDVNQNLVPIGVMGELVVSGDGVARGYTNPDLDRDTFVEVTINNTKVRAYRTGDRVRRRPKDGQVEFFGRIDRQVKLRGYRIEMAEVEHAMLRQDEVADAAVVLYEREGGDPELIGFVTSQGDDSTVNGKEGDSGQVESWGQQFDNNFYEGIDDIDESTLGSDFLGWTSMYDGNKIDRSEMQEWLDESMQTMLDGRPAGRVLEIGTGTGMVLMNLGDGLENYVGIDPSKPAVTFASEKIKETPALADKVQIYVGSAAEVNQIDSERSELVVLNSVVQYFPSPEYLTEVIEAVAQLSHVKRLFIGDVRSYPLNRQFLASRALYRLGEDASKTDIRQEIARLEDREEELLVDPAFFTGLQRSMSDVVEHVEILPKRMKATNELSSYRYAAVIYFKRGGEEQQEGHTVDGKDWTDFSARKMDRGALLQLLKDAGHGSPVAVSNIPYSKTISERRVVEALDAEGDADSKDTTSWLTEAQNAAKQSPTLSPTDLVELGEQAGFRTELSWSRQSSQKGGIDAIFHKHKPANNGTRTKFRFPTDDNDRSSSKHTTSLTNRPLQGQRNLQIERRVRKALKAYLPSYMVPRRVTVLDEMPLNANGKVDRKQLAKLAAKKAFVHDKTSASSSSVRPQNDEERALCEEFSNVLGVDVGPMDDFFGFGGHSLMAMRLLPKVSDRLGWHILLRDLYQNSTPRALYEAEKKADSANGEGGDEVKWPSYMELHSSRGDEDNESRAMLVLVHGFWGQGRIFAGLVPLLDERLDIIILHDPFFGRAEGPQSLNEWSEFYLEALQKRLPRDSRVILGGYSFGSFTALKMASLWKDWFDGDLVSLLLLDPAVWEPVHVDELSQEFLDEKFNYGLRLFGEDQKDFVQEHFKKFGPLMASPKDKPEYEGKGLHIASSQVAEQGVPKWWASNYPQLQQKCIDATHHGLFEEQVPMKEVSKAVNEHCRGIWSQ
ncbi:putative alpha/beta hydrolase-1, AMP-dependent synthetase/ligase, Condensation domain, AMP-binding [Septoria linicola]|nr:putative alpha/beta hydrolase-1, AMP-dependent synthetase/ligase, Condensation domain, AMP-binding [Septoria linicola]